MRVIRVIDAGAARAVEQPRGGEKDEINKQTRRRYVKRARRSAVAKIRVRPWERGRALATRAAPHRTAKNQTKRIGTARPVMFSA